jgi:transcriptional regulator with XRE-family HTH domain
MSDINWPKLIKDARLNLGETQERFAKRFAVTTNTVSRWETGTYQISLDAVEWLLEYSTSSAIRSCPRCGGKGIINEPQEASSLNGSHDGGSDNG